MSYLEQSAHLVRCEWGEEGVRRLGPDSDVVIIVDVLSFSTSVSIAIANGARVFPYPSRDETARQYAESVGALLASKHRRQGELSLSPASLLSIPSGTRLVLPSPNGSTLSTLAGPGHVLAGCLRNAKACARAALALGKRISVIPAGERWPDGSLRPALEDWLGAGAIIEALEGAKSPEARAAELSWQAHSGSLAHLCSALESCVSGVELIERDYARDVELAGEVDATQAVPHLRDGAYMAFRA